jgi:hypothetical protein
MTRAEWRALLEAFVAGRIGADAFHRRFFEGWRANRSGGDVPRAIETLFYTVEAFTEESELRREGDASEEEMLEAARKALQQLREEGDAGGGGYAARTYDRARTREDMRRFQVSLGRLAGLGCLIALAWIGLCLLQIFAVSDQIQSVLEWPAALATFAGVVLAFVPVVGNIIAFFGATDVWGWETWIAAVVFFAAPAATILSGWLRWWRP